MHLKTGLIKFVFYISYMNVLCVRQGPVLGICVTDRRKKVFYNIEKYTTLFTWPSSSLKRKGENQVVES